MAGPDLLRPVRSHAAVGGDPAARPGEDSHRGSGGMGGPRVMVVDDDQDFRETLRDLLSDQGFSVVGEARDGAEAVASVSSANPDVVLMDIRMPNMDGIQATRWIKSSLPAVQIVMLSAYGDPALKSGAEEAGGYCYLIKGCPPRIIRDVVQFAWRFKQEIDQRPEAGAVQGTLHADADRSGEPGFSAGS